MFKEISIICLVAALTMVSSAQAGNKKATKSAAPATSSGHSAPATKSVERHYGMPYGMAGCGLGSVIIHSNEVFPQIASAWLNNAFFPQTFAISSGSLNCKDSGEMQSMEREVFIRTNLASLSREASQGQGEHLEAFAEVLGCTGASERSTFMDVSKSNHGKIFTTETPEEVLNNYIGVIKANTVLSEGCQRIS